MAVTPFKFPRCSESLKIWNFSKGSGVRPLVVYCSNNVLLTLRDMLNPDLSFIFEKNASNEIAFMILAFLISVVGL